MYDKKIWTTVQKQRKFKIEMHVEWAQNDMKEYLSYEKVTEVIASPLLATIDHVWCFSSIIINPKSCVVTSVCIFTSSTSSSFSANLEKTVFFYSNASEWKKLNVKRNGYLNFQAAFCSRLFSVFNSLFLLFTFFFGHRFCLWFSISKKA